MPLVMDMLELFKPPLRCAAVSSRGQWSYRLDALSVGVACRCARCASEVRVPVDGPLPSRLECRCDVGVYGERF